MNKNLQQTYHSNNQKVFTLCDIASEHLNDLLDDLGLRYKSTYKMVYLPCPIHDGDNPSAINIYRDGFSVKGFWRCNTKHCEEKWGKNLIGFVRGVLSAQKGREVHFNDARNYICNFLGIKFEDIKVDEKYLEQQQFVKNQYIDRKVKIKGQIPREQVRKRLQIPAQYYLDRSFDRDILNEFDVGLCTDPNKEMFNRVVFPVYDMDNLLVGCVGRSIYSPCSSCGYYHSGKCPTADLGFSEFTKWRNSSNLNTGRNFFNFFRAKQWIERLGSTIIVEGQTDILKLEMAGIHNGLGLFGSQFTEDHQILLEGTGALSIVLCLDSDEAGRNGTEQIIKKLNRYYRIFTINLDSHDVGDMSIEEIKDVILPVVEKSYRRL